MKALILIILTLIACSCDTSNNNKMKSNGIKQIVLNIYPSGGGKMGYSIEVDTNVVIGSVKKMEVKDKNFCLVDVVSSKVRQLSAIEKENIINFIERLKNIEASNSEPIGLGTWTFTFYLENKRIISFVSNPLLIDGEDKVANDMNHFTKYLINLSPLDISFDGFLTAPADLGL